MVLVPSEWSASMQCIIMVSEYTDNVVLLEVFAVFMFVVFMFVVFVLGKWVFEEAGVLVPGHPAPPRRRVQSRVTTLEHS